MIGKLFRGLRKTRDRLTNGLASLFSRGRKLDEEFMDELEEVLYTSDLGPTGSSIVDELKVAWKKKEVVEMEDVPRVPPQMPPGPTRRLWRRPQRCSERPAYHPGRGRQRRW